MLTLILGGARSGKSRLAQRLAAETRANPAAHVPRVTYVATYRSDNDPEMAQRIERHRAARPPAWNTVEEPLALAAVVERTAQECDFVLVDCLTIWWSNLMWEHRGSATRLVEEIATAELHRIAAAASRSHVILVSNEVGSGVVPEHLVARAFRDLQGFVNQWAAEVADQVVLAVAGLPLYLKNPPRGADRS
jgi:adenosylcobinamide kinase / adenosylcobinamide-phosphate guanylyltransferase